MNKKQTIGLIATIIILGLIVNYVIPIVLRIYTDLSNYSRRVEQSYDYTKITTPLPRNIVEDICIKFEIELDDPRCLEDSVVYGPDFFADIKDYFDELPSELATFEAVEDKLGKYFVRCSEPDNEGYYRCIYDIRGDGKYPIGVYFNKENYYYQIFANTGGS
jgi:hypothetical protein